MFKVLLALPIWLLTIATAQAADPLAVLHYQTALGACERGTQMPMPKSTGSLKILQAQLKRYQRNMQDALKIDPKLKDSSQTYTGSYFVNLPFSKGYEQCENNLTSKVEEAEAAITSNLTERNNRQTAQQDALKALEKKQQAVKPFLHAALNKYCHPFLVDRTKAAPDSEQQYFAAKKQALAAYPEVGNEFHGIIFVDPLTNQETTDSKQVYVWFNLCEEAFKAPPAATVAPTTPALPATPAARPTAPTPVVEDEGPSLPKPAKQPTAQPAVPSVAPIAPTAVDKPPVDDGKEISDAESDKEYEAQMEAEYQDALKKMTGDRLKIMEQMKRVPDYVDDDDNDFAKAKTWQYEKDEGNKCDIFHFKDNTLVKTDNLKKECPPF